MKSIQQIFHLILKTKDRQRARTDVYGFVRAQKAALLDAPLRFAVQIEEDDFARNSW